MKLSMSLGVKRAAKVLLANVIVSVAGFVTSVIVPDFSEQVKSQFPHLAPIIQILASIAVLGIEKYTKEKKSGV